MTVKKAAGMALALLLAFGVYTVPYNADKGIAIVSEAAGSTGFIYTELSGGKKVIVDYDGEGGAITIPSNVAGIDAKAFANNADITSVIIPAGCYVSDYAFYCMPNLQKVTVKGSIDYIGEYAFACCTSLRTVTIKGNISQANENGGIKSYAFVNCTSLKTVDFTKENSKIDIIDGCAFLNCFNLSSINLPERTLSIGNAFLNCTKLTNVTVPEKTKIEKDINAFGYLYDYDTEDYYLADEITEVQANYFTYEKGKLISKTKVISQDPITLNVVKGSSAEKYAKANGISCKYVSSSSKENAVQTAVTVSAPTNVKSTSSSRKITLSWDKVNKADKYAVYIYNAKTKKYTLCGYTNSAKYTVSTLKTNTKYTFLIQALRKDNDGESYVKSSNTKYTASTSDTDTAAETVKTEQISVSAPENITSVSASHKITLKWDEVSSSDRYAVYIYNSDSKKYTLYQYVTSEKCTVTSLRSNTKYKFIIQAMKKASDGKYVSSEEAEYSASTLSA